MLPERESRPGDQTGAASISAATKTVPSLATGADDFGHVVVVSSTDGSQRRRCYLSLHSAEKAVERAESRGHVATLHLCRLVPVVAPEGLEGAAC